MHLCVAWSRRGGMGLAMGTRTVIDHRPMMKRIWIVMVVGAPALAACKGDKSLGPAAFGKVVAPPGDLAKLKIGMPIADAKKVAGDLLPGGKLEFETTPSGYTGMRYGVGVDDDHTKIDRIMVALPASGKDAVTKAWGPGVEGNCMGEDPCTYWFDPATGNRAVLEKGFRGLDLEFKNYLPASKLVGAKPAAFAFETTPILGATVDALRKAYPTFGEEHEKDGTSLAWLELPPVEYDEYFTRVYLDESHGTIGSYTLTVDYRPNPKAKDAILAEVEKAWGKATTVTDLGEQELQWLDPAANRRATASTRMDGEIEFKVEPYWPLAKFLGDAPDKLGWETTPLIGASAADLAKAYPQYAEGDAGDVTFKAPGTEWTSYTLVMFRLDEQGMVKGYTFSLSYEENPAAKDAIKAALEKKYGPAKIVKDILDRDELVLREANPRVSARDDDIMKGWDIEVGSEQ